VCKARIYFYAVSFQSVNSKACGSMAKEQLQKCDSKGIAASQPQEPPKDYGIKTQPRPTEAIIFIPFPFGLSHLPQRLVAKHFFAAFYFLSQLNFTR
jgi:hypothetical protein